MQRNDTLTMADYGRAVRRSTWTLALGAVAGALLLAVAGSASSNGFVQKVALRRTSGDAIASSLGLPSTLSLSWSPTSEVQRRLPVIEQTAPGARAEGDLTFVPE